MKMYLKVIVVVAVIVAATLADWSFISESLKLSDTCLLWINGRVQGWIEIVIFCMVLDAFIALPAIIIWDDINNMDV